MKSIFPTVPTVSNQAPRPVSRSGPRSERDCLHCRTTTGQSPTSELLLRLDLFISLFRAILRFSAHSKRSSAKASWNLYSGARPHVARLSSLNLRDIFPPVAQTITFSQEDDIFSVEQRCVLLLCRRHNCCPAQTVSPCDCLTTNTARVGGGGGD